MRFVLVTVSLFFNSRVIILALNFLIEKHSRGNYAITVTKRYKLILRDTVGKNYTITDILGAALRVTDVR